MTYKKGLTKSRYKAKMRNFWHDRWYNNVSISTWCGILSGEMWTTSMSFNQRKANELIFDAIEKLILEKKLSKDEAANLRSMLRSEDKENVHLAVMVIARLKPKAFSKTCGQATLSTSVQ